MRNLFFVHVVLGVLLTLPLEAGADVASYTLRYRDGRGSGAHAVPVGNRAVRMVAERVVLVPFYDKKRRQPMLMTHVWYDMEAQGAGGSLRVGFPELRALVDKDLSWSKRPWDAHDVREYSWTYPTISRFWAWGSSGRFAVTTYPGIGEYRQWFGFGFTLPAKRTVRIHNAYISNLGRPVIGDWSDEDRKRGRTTKYFVHYILHTGALWRGTIGKGEVFLYHRGELLKVRQFTNLKPSKRDDIHLELDQKLIEWDQWERATEKQWAKRIPDLSMRFPHGSGNLGGETGETHVGFAVDGDPATAWVSPRGAALGAWVQLPSDPDRGLVAISINPGTPPKGSVRPSKVLVHCLNRKRKGILGSLTLPNASAPVSLTLAKPAKCRAIRVEVKGVHGAATASVALAEVEQRFRKKSTWKPKKARPAKEYVVSAPRGAPRTGALAFDQVRIEEVRWSSDGSRLHYRMVRENTTQPVNGAVLGYMVKSDTGERLLTYRVTREGTLPAALEKEWAGAKPLAKGIALLRQGGFGAVVQPGRQPPSDKSSSRLGLKGQMGKDPGAVHISENSSGYRWDYRVPGGKRPQVATLELELHSPKGKGRLLTSQTIALDPLFAARHSKIWKARRRFYKDLVYVFNEQWSNDGQHNDTHLPDAVWKHMPEVWHRLVYPYSEAYGGDAQLFWEPQGRSVAVLWRHRQDMSSHRPVESSAKFPKDSDGNLDYFLGYGPQGDFYGKYISHCARDLLVMVCPWDRHGEPRFEAAVTVHALVKPPSKTKKPVTMKVAQVPEKRTTHTRKGGCACEEQPGQGSSGGTVWGSLLLIMLAAGLVLLLRARVVWVLALVALGLMWPRGQNVQAMGEATVTVELKEFAKIPIPAGARPFAPRGMEGRLFMGHYRVPEKSVTARLRTALRSAGWKLRRDREGAQHPWLTSNFRELEVLKGKVRLHVAIVRYSETQSILYITRK